MSGTSYSNCRSSVSRTLLAAQKLVGERQASDESDTIVISESIPASRPADVPMCRSPEGEGDAGVDRRRMGRWEVDG